MCAVSKTKSPAPPPPPIEVPELEIPAADSPSQVRARRRGGRSQLPSSGLQIPSRGAGGTAGLTI